MKLLKYENYTLTFEPEILAIKVFNKLHKRDKTLDKHKFIEELSYIYFFADPRSDYQYITEPTERSKAILEGEGITNLKIDKDLQEAIDYYSSFKPTSVLLLEDTKIAIEKVRQFLREVDLNTLDDRGKPIYTINSITATIKQIPQLAKDVLEAEKIVSKDMEEQGRARGGNEGKKVFEDGFKFKK